MAGWLRGLSVSVYCSIPPRFGSTFSLVCNHESHSVAVVGSNGTTAMPSYLHSPLTSRYTLSARTQVWHLQPWGSGS